MQTTRFNRQTPDRRSLKLRLVETVANGNQYAAEELRLLMKLTASETLRGSKKFH